MPKQTALPGVTPGAAAAPPTAATGRSACSAAPNPPPICNGGPLGLASYTIGSGEKDGGIGIGSGENVGERDVNGRDSPATAAAVSENSFVLLHAFVAMFSFGGGDASTCTTTLPPADAQQKRAIKQQEISKPATEAKPIKEAVTAGQGQWSGCFVGALVGARAGLEEGAGVGADVGGVGVGVGA